MCMGIEQQQQQQQRKITKETGEEKKFKIYKLIISD